ncbi:polyprenyl synthetase solanesyl diphosphate synthase [Dialister succinatiphilus]|uniref:polyprenyl synthetase solanesyl diphosphate synthase n=1 Tax=Dialister succinatiphilus TaxID=487173 RepID=UPI003AB284A7
MDTKNTFNEKRLLNKAEFCTYIGLGHTRAEQWAIKNGVVRHIGRRVLYDRAAIDKVLDSLSCDNE